jgi:hypothetical protein
MYGSLNNRMYEAMTIGAPEPAVGMPATITHYTDRDPATVVGWDGKILAVTEDDYKRVDSNGMSESQTYEYTSNFDAAPHYFRRGKDGRWQRVFKNPATGRWRQHGRGPGLIVGFREKYHDFSF